MIKTLAPMPSPATRNMIPAACSAFSLHSIVVPLVAFLSCSPLKMPAPGMPLEIVLLREEDIFFLPALHLAKLVAELSRQTDLILI